MMDIRKVKATIIHLLKLNNTPHGIALGVAIGVFIAITPTYGLHTVLVVIAAFLIPQANKMAIFLGTNISLPPTLPFITWGGYEIGRLVLDRTYPDLSEAYFSSLAHLSLWGIIKSIKHMYKPLFVGSVILGAACAVIFYVIVFLVARAIKKKKAR